MAMILLAGVPGCGKSTWARTLFPPEAIVSADAIRKVLFGTLPEAHTGDRKEKNRRVFELHDNAVRSHLRAGTNVVVDNTSLTLYSREAQLKHCEEFDADCHLILFTDVLTAVKRNSQRFFTDREAMVPEDIMGSMVKNFYDTLASLITGESGMFESVTYISRYE